HVSEVFGADAADLYQRRGVSRREQRQIVQERLHRGIEPVAILELKRETFLQGARRDARWIELLHARQHRQEARDRAGETYRQLVEAAGEIARLVDHFDQLGADHSVGRVGDVDGKLVEQMLA